MSEDVPLLAVSLSPAINAKILLHPDGIWGRALPLRTAAQCRHRPSPLVALDFSCGILLLCCCSLHSLPVQFDPNLSQILPSQPSPSAPSFCLSRPFCFLLLGWVCSAGTRSDLAVCCAHLQPPPSTGSSCRVQPRAGWCCFVTLELIFTQACGRS